MKKLFGIGPDSVGDGKVTFEWSPKGNYLALAGSKRKCCIVDRNGKLFDEVHFPPAESNQVDRSCSVAAMQWDPAGEQLAILPAGNSFAFLWNSLTKEFLKIDSEFKTQEFTALGWSRNGIYLACGTIKGNLMIYNAREKKKMPFVGKHTKRIVACVWNKDNVLAMAGQDRLITLTDGVTGDTIKTFQIKDLPQDLCVADRKDDGYARREENTYSINVARKTLYMMQMSAEGDRPMELAFMESYGAIQKHMWYGDGYILLGFRNGYVVIVSSHTREISEEVHSGKYTDILTDLAYSASLNRIAMGGANSIRIMDAGGDYQEQKSDAIDLDPNQSVEKLGWTKDGQVLTVGTQNGYLYSYLAALPVVFDFHDRRVIYLTSLLEMSVMDVARRAVVSRLQLETEPAFCGLGPSHAAIGMNNQVWFYDIESGGGKLVSRRDYMNSITTIKLNDTHAAALMSGQVVVHPIVTEAGHAADDHDVVIPPPGQPSNITCVALTGSFVIVGSKAGTLSYYLMPEVTPVNEFRHEGGGITRLWPQPAGSRLVFEDEKGLLHLFNPVNDHAMTFPGFTGRCEVVLWDTADGNVLVLHDGSQLHVYVYMPASLGGPLLQAVVTQGLPNTHTPLVLNNGALGCRLKNGAVDSVMLESHKNMQANDAVARAAPQRRFSQALKLFKLKDAYECAVQMRQADMWKQLALQALEALDVDTAIAAYRQIGDASMVLSLERVRGYEDRNLLAGHIMVLLERDYVQAQEVFLRSSIPRAALEMRMDLKHWAEALKLAEQHDPENIALICKEHAAMLEMTGEYSAAKSHYQQAIDSMTAHPSGSSSFAALELACKSGIARTTLQLGDLRQGRQMAIAIGSKDLFKECALVLEGMQQLTEAAEMYERAGQYERAASIYIQTKNFAAATPLMARISSSKLQLQFAKAKEAEGRFGEAAAAYEAAGDMDSVVRLCLERLNAPQKAYTIVRKTQSVEAANVLVRYCLQTQDFQGAVEFLLMANQMDQAFDIAQGHNEMDTFARIVSAQAKPVDYQRIAQYYESRGEYDKAADMWCKCEQYSRAIQLYIKVGTDAALEKSIAVVEKTKAHQLGVVVLDYVNEEKDGSAKDEFRFKLNIAMGQYADAAKDALEMARLEQEEGNYRVAHDKLFGTVKQLEALGAKPTMELTRALMLLHSYTLVKSLIAVNDHTCAARMLVRVARSISKFPKHIVPILTSTVIECHRAGLKKTAFEYASMLMRPEYRDQVAVKYKKKIELMVRKPDKDAEELEEVMVDCCYCNMPGPETELQCVSCQNLIPFDLSTGKRMVLTDWTECPACKFPASMSQFPKIIQAEQRCPMCNEQIEPSTIKRIMDPMAKLKAKQGASVDPAPPPVSKLVGADAR